MTSCKKTDMFMKAIKKAGGGKVQTSSDTARKLAKEMGGMKKGGAAMPREGISTRPTGPGGRRITMKDLEQSNRDIGGMSAAQVKAAGEAIGRGNRTPPEKMPPKVIKRAQGGSARTQDMPVQKVAVKGQGGLFGISKAVRDAMPANAKALTSAATPAAAPKGTTKPAGGVLGKLVQRAAAAPAAATPAAAPKGRTISPAARERVQEMMEAKRGTKQAGAPVMLAKGGAGKVRKGMMSETGDIRKAVKPKKGIGGIM